MKYSKLLLVISLLLLFSCNRSKEITIEQSKLKILNDTIGIGDSLILNLFKLLFSY